MRTLLFSFLFCVSLTINAQIQFIRKDSVPVTVNLQALDFPWAGGINYAQFSEIDLDQDGTMDLFVFDRTGNKITTYINNGTPNQVDYSIAPQYITKFPLLHDWAILRDYNCDGKMDIFTAYTGSSPGISIWENTSTMATGISFQLVANPLKTNVTPNSTNTISTLWVTNVDIPAVRDIDNDGDLDVLTFDGSGVQVEFHRNYSKENFGTCDSLRFQLESQCWGKFSENTLNANLNLNVNCPLPPIANPDPLPSVLHNMHNGSCLECINTDNDSDQDLLIGDLSSQYIAYTRNGGDTANALMDTVDTRYPNYDSTVTANIWNCGFHLDVDNDGNKDILFSPNAPNSSENFKSVWYYHNTSTNMDVRAQFVQNNFLQDNMIETGEGAFPRFFDYDNDGDDDLFIGNYGYYSSSGTYPSKIALYKNIGTTTTASFKLETDDFIDLYANTSNLLCPVPAFGDLDGDGDEDMVIGDASGKLHYYRKDPGPADNFIFVSSNYSGIDVGNYSTPQLVDVDRDGKLDMLIGEQSGTVNYYRNTGTTTVPAFALTSGFFGSVNVSQVGFTTGYSVPYLWDNSGSYTLLVGSERGFLFRYDNIDGNLSGSFTLTDSLYVSSREGLRIAPWMGHLNNDTLPELIIGNYAGGVSLFFGDVINSVNEFALGFAFGLYPNPTATNFTLNNPLPQKELPATFSIMNMEGQIILTKPINSSSEQIDVVSFPAGIYICRLQSKSGMVSHQKLVISK